MQPGTPEPKDKLDAMTGVTATVASTTAKVNGPEDDLDEWGAIDWRAHEDNVGRLRQRIFKAAQEADHRKVRQLQLGFPRLTGHARYVVWTGGILFPTPTKLGWPPGVSPPPWRR